MVTVCWNNHFVIIHNPDHSGRNIRYRYLSSEDDVDEITRMPHDAYAPLAEAGMRFHASHQNRSVTQERMAKGETIVIGQVETLRLESVRGAAA